MKATFGENGFSLGVGSLNLLGNEYPELSIELWPSLAADKTDYVRIHLYLNSTGEIRSFHPMNHKSKPSKDRQYLLALRRCIDEALEELKAIECKERE